MATPRAAEHRDLEERLKKMEAKLDRLSAQVLRQRQLAVTQGDLVVSGGGGIKVLDGGTIQAEDEAGHMIVDMGGTDGIRRPWLPYHVPIMDWRYTTAGTFTTLAAAYGFSQHPYVRLWVNTFSDAGTTGEYRVGFQSNAFDASTAVWNTPATISAGDSGSGRMVMVPSQVDYGQMAVVFVQARRTSGTGQVGVSVQYCYGSGAS